MFIQPSGKQSSCLIERDRVSFHQSMRCPRVLAFEEPLFNVIRQLKGTHPNIRSYQVLPQTHHIPAVAKQYQLTKRHQARQISRRRFLRTHSPREPAAHGPSVRAASSSGCYLWRCRAASCRPVAVGD